MAKKENKGGVLTNEQVEKDNAVKGKKSGDGHLQGSQDTGDTKVSHLGTKVQQSEGLGDKEEA